MRAELLSTTDYLTSNWSGGTTTQLLIEPPRAEYAARDFLWRISSASVSLPESDFTALPDYDRFIAVIDGGMTLSHDGGAPLELTPGVVHRFSGASATHSVGRCTDFNLMLRRGLAEGTMQAVRAGTRSIEVDVGTMAEQALIFSAGESCTVMLGGAEYTLRRGESLLLSGLRADTAAPVVRLSSPRPDTLVMLCRMWRTQAV